MTRGERLYATFDAYERGDLASLESLFAPDAQWFGVPGSGFEGETPI